MTESADDSRPVILVADGDVLIRYAISDFLRECGYLVIEASSSDEATLVLGDQEVRIDVLLCDVKIGGAMNGFELGGWLREHRPTVQLVLAGNVASVAEAAATLCDDGPQVGRPYEAEAVVEHIRRLLASRA